MERRRGSLVGAHTLVSRGFVDVVVVGRKGCSLVEVGFSIFLVSLFPVWSELQVWQREQTIGQRMDEESRRGFRGAGDGAGDGEGWLVGEGGEGRWMWAWARRRPRAPAAATETAARLRRLLTACNRSSSNGNKQLHPEAPRQASATKSARPGLTCRKECAKPLLAIIAGCQWIL